MIAQGEARGFALGYYEPPLRGSQTNYLLLTFLPLVTLEAGDFFVVISYPALTELVLRFFVDDGNGMDGQCL